MLSWGCAALPFSMPQSGGFSEIPWAPAGLGLSTRGGLVVAGVDDPARLFLEGLPGAALWSFSQTAASWGRGELARSGAGLSSPGVWDTWQPGTFSWCVLTR